MPKLIVAGICTFLLAFSAALPAWAGVFSWPDPAKHSRVILYADQMLGDYLKQYPDWFKSDFLVAGLYIDNVAYGTSDEAIKKFSVLYEQLRLKGVIVGTTISATTATHELSLKKYPENAASMEDMSVKTRYLGVWAREADQQMVDISDPVSRRELQSAIRELWLHVPMPMRFVDNAAVHPRMMKLQPWAIYCQNISELRSLAEALHGNVIFNVLARPWELSDQETAQLIDAVRGNGGNAISLPVPWSRSIKDNKNALGWAMYRYRQILDNHIAVILIPSMDAPQDVLLNWVSTWRRTKDKVYIATPYWEMPLGP